MLPQSFASDNERTVSPAVAILPGEVQGDDDRAPDYSNYLENLLRKQRNEPTADESESAESPMAVAETVIVQAAKPQAAAPSASESKVEAPQKPKIGSPVDLAAILRKQGFSVEEDESPADLSTKTALPEPRKSGTKMAANEHANPAPVGEVIAGPVNAKSGGEEESIDDYMSKLMARVRGGDAPSAPAGSGGARAIDGANAVGQEGESESGRHRCHQSGQGGPCARAGPDDRPGRTGAAQCCSGKEHQH